MHYQIERFCVILVRNYYHFDFSVHTIIQEEFQVYITKMLDQREEKYIQKKSIRIKALPEFVELFKNTSYLSSKIILAVSSSIETNGKFANMVKGSKKKREGKKQKRENHEEEKVGAELIDQKNRKIEELEQQLRIFEKMKIENNKNGEKLNKLYQLGMINDQGEPVSNEME